MLESVGVEKRTKFLKDMSKFLEWLNANEEESSNESSESDDSNSAS